jgi:hypothetical protein
MKNKTKICFVKCVILIFVLRASCFVLKYIMYIHNNLVLYGYYLMRFSRLKKKGLMELRLAEVGLKMTAIYTYVTFRH